ncbi:glycosyltransferase family 2 protein [Paenibacillus sp. BSR1-1]|uniref:glycosyltransferase family 2 protein n=1 Tax=Paenibacillus sp. BSR1-1 TaxID=3020845 RepID=UPI0025AF54F0|nr:glycosyltransferase family 2 protein [Paenibacillus sp. BSR1-1]MDN3019195.1 glycosyltransferase family 2 protein [Paenibacillus sp. BSR1-1]
MLDITISIVTYNSALDIDNALVSIISKIDKRIKYKIFIVDNNSKDNTLLIVSKYKNNVEVIKMNKNVGFGAGHNIVLDRLNSKFHIIVNPDIIINNSVINDMYDYMDEHFNIGLLTPKVKYPNGDMQYLCKRDPNFFDLFIRLLIPFAFKKRQSRYMMLDKNYDEPFKVPYATGCFMFFRTDVFKEIKGFDERFFLHFEDADITRRVNEKSEVIFYPYNYVIHDWKRESKKKLRLILIMVKSAFMYFKKWGLRFY